MLILQIFLISSLILNSSLLIYLFGLLPFLLFLSVLFNVVSVVYMYFLLHERINVQNDFSSLLLRSENFLDHVKSIYELEMFYGDETLESLIIHSKELVNNFYEHEDKHYTPETEDPQEEYDNDRTENQEDPLDDSQEKPIFHQSS